MRNPVLAVLFAVGIMLTGAGTVSAQPEPLRFTGEGSERTASFEMSGPWLLDWTVTSDTPLLANLDMRLHDGDTGEFLGNIAQLDGTGRGLRLFEEGGSYSIAVVAANLRWELEVSALDEAEAQRLKRQAAESGPSMEEGARRARAAVPEGSFSSWRAESETTLLLFDESGTGWRITFERPCRGLESATALSFVTPARGDLDVYDSILLEDGTRCRFASAIPTVTD